METVKLNLNFTLEGVFVSLGNSRDEEREGGEDKKE
jgi:hypothetical protein